MIDLDVHLYADDTQLLASTTIQSISECRRELESCVLSFQCWCATSRLQLNADKSELIWFGSAANVQRLQTVDTCIHIAGTDITPVNSVRDLGIFLDGRLDMRTHVSKIASVCFFHLRRLRHLFMIDHTINGRQDNASTAFSNRSDRYPDTDLSENPDSNHFRLKFWRRWRFALSECSCLNR